MEKRFVQLQRVYFFFYFEDSFELFGVSWLNGGQNLCVPSAFLSRVWQPLALSAYQMMRWKDCKKN